jgi:hypothetical protein
MGLLGSGSNLDDRVKGNLNPSTIQQAGKNEDEDSCLNRGRPHPNRRATSSHLKTLPIFLFNKIRPGVGWTSLFCRAEYISNLFDVHIHHSRHNSQFEYLTEVSRPLGAALEPLYGLVSDQF